MAVRAEESDVVGPVVGDDTIDVVYLESDRFAMPIRTSAAFRTGVGNAEFDHRSAEALTLEPAGQRRVPDQDLRRGHPAASLAPAVVSRAEHVRGINGVFPRGCVEVAVEQSAGFDAQQSCAFRDASCR